MSSAYGIFQFETVQRAIADLIASLAITTARTVYINPSFATNGDGTTWTQAATPGGVGAFNAWGTGSWASGAQDLTHFWRSGTRYLQAAETEWSTMISVYASVGIILGTYDPDTGEQIQDNTRHAKIYATTGNGLQLGTFSATRRLILIDNLDVRALDRTTNGTYGITGNAAYNYVADIGVVRCILDGYRCTQPSCAGQTYIGNGFYGYGDGIGALTTKARAEYNTKLSDPLLPINPAEFDLIAFEANNTYAVDSFIISNNDIRLPVGGDTQKQGAYFYNGNARATNIPTGPMRIEGNRIAGTNQAVLSMFDNTVVRGNLIDRSALRVIAMWGAGAYICGNLSTNSPGAIAVSLNAAPTAIPASTTSRVVNNTFLDVLIGISDATSAVARDTVIYNNVLRRVKQTDEADTAMRHVNTVASATITAAGNCFYNDPADTAEFAAIGGVVKTFAEWQAGWDATGLNTDPLLDDTGHPLEGSPLEFSGTYNEYSGTYDPDGMVRNIPPSRGAREYRKARASRL